jgi:hypothetical protein
MQSMAWKYLSESNKVESSAEKSPKKVREIYDRPESGTLQRVTFGAHKKGGWLISECGDELVCCLSSVSEFGIRTLPISLTSSGTNISSPSNLEIIRNNRNAK